MIVSTRRTFLASTALTLSATAYTPAAHRPNDSFCVADMGAVSNEKQSTGIAALHIRNFLDVIRGNAKTLNAEIEEGHKSSRVCHLGDAAFRSGKTLQFDAKTEAVNEDEATPYLTREYRKGFELPGL